MGEVSSQGLTSAALALGLAYWSSPVGIKFACKGYETTDCWGVPGEFCGLWSLRISPLHKGPHLRRGLQRGQQSSLHCRQTSQYSCSQYFPGAGIQPSTHVAGLGSSFSPSLLFPSLPIMYSIANRAHPTQHRAASVCSHKHSRQDQ